MRSASEGGFCSSQAARSYLRFPTTASTCGDWSSAWVMHESALRLNVCIPKLCVEEMCSTCVSIVMLHLPFYNFEKVVAYQ